MRLHRINAMLLRYWYLTWGKLPRLFDIFYWPVVGVVVFGFTTLYLVTETALPQLVVYILGGVILWLLFQRISQDITVYMIEEFWEKNVAGLFVTPLTAGELAASLIIMSIVRGIITLLLLVALALFAYHFFTFAIWHTALFVIPLFIFSWGVGLIVCGAILRFGTRIDVLAWGATFFFQPFAAVYYPLSTMPGWMQVTAHGTPLMYAFEGYRLAYQGTFSLQYFLAGSLLAIVYLAFGVFIFLWGVQEARKRGLLTQN